MSIPELYTVLPKSGDELNIEVLTDLRSDIVDGTNDEKYVVLSYFPETQKFSERSSIVLNKYVLFVLNGSDSSEYEVEWLYDVFDYNGISILSEFLQDEMETPSEFEFNLGLEYIGSSFSDSWEHTILINCVITKNGGEEKTLALQQTILPIEADLLSENLDTEGSGDDSAVALGHEPTTHFMRGHLSEYLINKKESLIAEDTGSLDNASVFVNQTAAIAYNNLLRFAERLMPDYSGSKTAASINAPFNHIFSNIGFERDLIHSRDFSSGYFRDIGICSLNLHHVLPIVLGKEMDRIVEESDLVEFLEEIHSTNFESFVLAYQLCRFPKSAINLSVDIFERLFQSFKTEAHEDFHIYLTRQQNQTDRNAKIAEWTDLTHSELNESSNDQFMKNLIAEGHMGYYLSVTSYGFEQSNARQITKIDGSQFIQKILTPPPRRFTLDDFLQSNEILDLKVEEIFSELTPHERVAQMLMPAAAMAWKEDIHDEDNDGHVDDWVRDFTRDGPSILKIPKLLADRKIGGVLLLNGTKDQVARWSRDFIAENKRAGGLPLLISADAEPSLINDKIRGLPAVKKANKMTSLSEVEETAIQICDLIQEYGINYNFAPVVDVAKNFLKKRGFGTDHQVIVDYSKKFIETVQNRNIIATAKHFPGHGEVIGDTHQPVSGGDDEDIVVIDGEFKELDVYPPLIADGVLSIMIAHIVVRNNDYHTDGFPASVSKRIVTDLLRDQLGFKGLIVTDGMNMGAVTYVEDECIKAVEAGVDIIEIPLNPSQTHADILARYNSNEAFADKVNTACKRILRMKICLGLI